MCQPNTDTSDRGVPSRDAIPKLNGITGSLLARAVEALPDIFFIFDLEGRVIHYNQACLNITGYAAQDVPGLRLNDFVCSEDKSRIEAAVREVYERGEVTVEADLVTREGRRLAYQFHSSRLVDDCGNTIGFSGIGRDISEKIKATAALKESETRLRTLVTGAGMGIAYAALDGSLTEVNPAFARMIGYEPEELIGVSFRTITHPDDVVIEDRYIEETRRSAGMGYQFEKRFIHKNGSIVWASLAATVFRDECGIARCVIITADDITERKGAELALIESEEKFRNLVEQSPVGIYILQEYKFVYVNPSLASIIQYTPDEIVSRPSLFDFIAERDREKVQRNIQRRLDGEVRSLTYHIIFLKKDGREVEVEVHGTVTTYRGIPSIIGTLLDVSEQKKAEEILRTSEERYRKLIQNSSDVVSILDANGVFVYVADSIRNITGYEAADLTGQSSFELVHPDDQPAVRETFEAATQRPEHSATVEARLKHVDGQWIFAEAVAINLEHDPAIGGVLVTTRNVHARKLTEKALAASEVRYRTIMEEANDPIIITDLETGNIIDVNQKAEQLVGRPMEELTGMYHLELYPEEIRERCRVLFEMNRNKPNSLFRDLQVLHVDGHLIPIEISASVFELDGRVVVQGIYRDVTEQRSYETRLIEARRRAEEMNRLKSAFLANMSHEIRTPLTSIIGFAEVLRSEVTGEGSEFAEMIHSNGQRLLDTLNSVLDLAQLESKELRLKPYRYDLVRQIEETITLFRTRASQAGLYIVFDGPPCLEVTLDRAAVGRILNNLLSNAIKFTEQGGISITMETVDGRVILHVADTGIGIGPEFLPHLFDEFQQESSGIDRNYEGSGLGLSITKRLTELMQGSIQVSSTKNRGSVFTVSLPVTIA